MGLDNDVELQCLNNFVIVPFLKYLMLKSDWTLVHGILGVELIIKNLYASSNLR